MLLCRIAYWSGNCTGSDSLCGLPLLGHDLSMTAQLLHNHGSVCMQGALQHHTWPACVVFLMFRVRQA